ncbi:MAG: acyltransferase [Prevotella sp.]|nr:acyltransferase [Prevotella sp.]
MIPTLQSLRFIFVMMIFMSHFAYGGIEAFEAGGDCGVAFFFLLSGFVLSKGYGRRLREGTFSYSRYLRRRLLKIYPLHLLCLVVVLLISRQSLGLPVLLNVLLLQSWVPSTDFYFSCNAVSWFLSCLLFCYLLFPWAYRHASRQLTAVVLACCLAAYLLVPYDRVNSLLYVNPLVRFVDFYLGIVLCRYLDKKPLQRQPAWTELLLVAVLILALLAYPYTDAKLRNAPLFWVVLLPFIAVFASGEGLLSRSLLNAKPLLWLGSLSMPFFMLHPMTFSVLMRHLPAMPPVLMLALCFAVVVLLSWVVDRLFLQPVQRLTNKQ